VHEPRFGMRGSWERDERLSASNSARQGPQSNKRPPTILGVLRVVDSVLALAAPCCATSGPVSGRRKAKHVLSKGPQPIAEDPSPRRRFAALWLALLTISIVTHFIALGGRAMSHDESIHAHLSWELFASDTYAHDPTYHGPLLFHLNAVVYSLFGDSDATSRWGPAGAGVLLLLAVFPLRRYLGEAGALSAALLIVISPSLLFYGRYLRNDIYMALFATLWALALLRYLEARRARWLVVMTAAMALSFAAKETAFITGLSLGSFLALLALARARRGRQAWRESAAAEAALSMLLLVLPFAAPLLHLLLAWDPLDYTSAVALQRGTRVAAGLGALSVASAWMVWGRRRPRFPTAGLGFRHWLALFVFFWTVQIALFSSALRSMPRGLVSGVVGSLGYWLGQHGVARGGQPGSYYLILLALYEFLPLLLTGAAAFALWRRGSGELPEAGPRAEVGRIAVSMLAWWTLVGFLAYSLAGEKMPWLTLHIALPMILLAGWWLGRLLESIDWRRWPAARLWIPALLPLILLRSLSRLLGTPPGHGRTIDAIRDSSSLLFALVSTLATLTLLGVWLRRRRADGDEGRVLALGFVFALAVFTVQASWRLSFRDDELATELMVYAHATPDIKRALADTAEIAARAGLAGESPIAYGAETSWPFNWYLRHHRKRLFFGAVPNAQVASVPFILAGPGDDDTLWPFLGDAYARRDLNLLWWPIERLTKFGAADIVATLGDAQAARAAWNYIASRQLPEREERRWPNRKEFRMYVRRDLLEESWGLRPAPAIAVPDGQEAAVSRLQEIRVEPLGALSGPFAGEHLKLPTQIAVAADGRRAIADSGNHRVVLLARDGALIRSVGGACAEGEPCAGGLKEPWGVAMLPRGDLAVADTWHGKIRVFDAQGRQRSEFGELQVDGTPPFASDRLYGPRGILFHPRTNRLLIADTGHHRLLARDDHGDVLEIGAPGIVAGHFQEPVGLAMDPRDGSVLVADTWNRRIQRLDQNLSPISSWPVPGWRGRGAYNKPYLAVDDRGFVYASDPDAARVLVFDGDGNALGALVGAGWRGARHSIPLGVAVDAERGELLVSDAALGRLWILALWPEGDAGSAASVSSPPDLDPASTER